MSYHQWHKSANRHWGYSAVILPVIWLPLCSNVLWFNWKGNPDFFFFFPILKGRETVEILNIWISISNGEGISADCCLLEVEVYSPFLDLVTASWWEAGTCGRSPSVLWICREKERNISWGQLDYVPVLLQASSHYCLWKYILCISSTKQEDNMQNHADFNWET